MNTPYLCIKLAGNLKKNVVLSIFSKKGYFCGFKKSIRQNGKQKQLGSERFGKMGTH